MGQTIRRGAQQKSSNCNREGAPSTKLINVKDNSKSKDLRFVMLPPPGSITLMARNKRRMTCATDVSKQNCISHWLSSPLVHQLAEGPGRGGATLWLNPIDQRSGILFRKIPVGFSVGCCNLPTAFLIPLCQCNRTNTFVMFIGGPENLGNIEHSVEEKCDQLADKRSEIK